MNSRQLFFVLLCLRTSMPGAHAEGLRASSRDALFTQEPPIVCNLPIKNPQCAGLCTEMKLPYDEMKDVNGRDENPKRGFAKPEYFDLKGLRQHKIRISTIDPRDVTEVNALPEGKLFTWEDAEAADVRSPGSTTGDEKPARVTTYEVGNPDAGATCTWATIWVHGSTPVVGGLGVTDNLFGGQFNRMRHLAVDNSGVYYSPSIEDFDDATALATVVKRIRTKTCPRGKIILNCGSAGTSACWKVANDKKAGSEIGGMVLIGSVDGPADAKTFLASDLAKARVPILFAQGERDGPEHWRDLALKIHDLDPSYPVRFVVYKGGGHMTPLRMLDWKSTVTCMLAQAPAPPNAGSAPAPRYEKSSSAQ